MPLRIRSACTSPTLQSSIATDIFSAFFQVDILSLANKVLCPVAVCYSTCSMRLPCCCRCFIGLVTDTLMLRCRSQWMHEKARCQQWSASHTSWAGQHCHSVQSNPWQQYLHLFWVALLSASRASMRYLPGGHTVSLPYREQHLPLLLSIKQMLCKIRCVSASTLLACFLQSAELVWQHICKHFCDDLQVV